jgi:hypothetical protein
LGEQNQCIKYKVCDFESLIIVAKNGPSFYYWSSEEEKECSSMLLVILWDSNGLQEDFYIFFFRSENLLASKVQNCFLPISLPWISFFFENFFLSALGSFGTKKPISKHQLL